MVTHHIQLCLPAASFLVRLDQGGTVGGYGTVEELQHSDKLIEACCAAGNAASSATGSSSATETRDDIIDDNMHGTIAEEQQNYSLNEQRQDENIGKLIQDEQSEKGHVKIKVYLTYLRACGGWLFWITLAIFFSTSRALVFAENWYEI